MDIDFRKPIIRIPVPVAGTPFLIDHFVNTQIPFEQAGRIPEPGDNTAVAIRPLRQGDRVLMPAA